jgi:hypothetical protein
MFLLLIVLYYIIYYYKVFEPIEPYLFFNTFSRSAFCTFVPFEPCFLVCRVKISLSYKKRKE